MKFALIFAIASLVSGALFCLALPPTDFWFFGWIAFVPLMIAVRGRGFLFGFIGGLLALFTTAYLVKSGVFYSQKAFIGEDGWIMTGCGLFGFVASILLGFWADKGTTKPVWWFAALAVLLEASLLVVLPAHLALTQYRQTSLLWTVSVGGVLALSFLLWFVNLSLAASIRLRKWKQLVLSVSLVAVLSLASPLFNLHKESSKTGFGLVQTDKTDEESLGRLHRQAQATADVVVWPEFAGLGIAIGGDTKPLQELAGKSGGAAIITSYNDRFQPKPHNVASLISPTETSESYFKRKLFGGEKNMHTPGDRAVAVGPPDRRIALGICFDSCYPSIVREAANLPGVVAMALPTIDPESPHHFIAAIHAAFTPIRAAENGIVIGRADGFAFSMVVGADGAIVAELGPGEATGGGMAPIGRATLYRHFGDWFLYLCGMGVAFGLFAYRKPKKKAALGEEERLKAFADEAIREMKA